MANSKIKNHRLYYLVIAVFCFSAIGLKWFQRKHNFNKHETATVFQQKINEDLLSIRSWFEVVSHRQSLDHPDVSTRKTKISEELDKYLGKYNIAIWKNGNRLFWHGDQTHLSPFTPQQKFLLTDILPDHQQTDVIQDYFIKDADLWQLSISTNISHFLNHTHIDFSKKYMDGCEEIHIDDTEIYVQDTTNIPDNWMFLLYIVGLLALCLLGNEIANTISRERNPLLGLATIGGLLILITISIVLSKSSKLDGEPFLLIGDRLVLSGLLLWFCLYFFKKIKPSNTANLAIWQQILGYTIICLLGIGCAAVTKDHIFNTTSNYHFSTLYGLGWESILTLLVLFLIYFSFFLVSYRLISIIRIKNIKWPYVGVALLVSLPLLWWLNLQFPIWLYALTMVVIFLLFDLFFDSRNKGFTWVIGWLIIFCSFAASLIYHYSTLADHEKIGAVIGQIEEDNEELSPLVHKWEHVWTKENISTKNQILQYLQTSEDVYRDYDISNITVVEATSVAPSSYHKDADKAIFLINLPSFKKQVSLELKSKFKERFQKLISARMRNQPFALYRDINRIINHGIGFPKTISADEQIPSSTYETTNSSYTLLQRNTGFNLSRPISAFSFLFIFTLLLTLLIFIVHSIVPFLPAELTTNLFDGLSLRNKIQLAILSLLIVSFLIIGLVTAYHFQLNKKRNINNELADRSLKLEEDLKTFNISSKQDIHSYLTKEKSEFVLYDALGALVASGNKNAYVPHPVIDFDDYANIISYLSGKKSNIEIQNSDILRYHPILEASQLTNIIAVPKEVIRPVEMYDFLGTLLNTYVLLLLLSTALAITVSDSITRPLFALSEKIRSFHLGKSNEKIKWQGEDELGQLIATYNDMIEKLDISAQRLAKSEREVAWREMAKQVAHEIKNPLTPMKLSIQHLELKAQRLDDDEVKEMIQKVSATLVEQIDNLSRIAGEFSKFAQMPKPQMELISLNQMLRSIHDLFGNRSDIDFKLYDTIDDITVKGDKNHLLQVLNNLIKNAIQAIPDSKRGIINIRLKHDNILATIEIEDNGKGIPEELRQKVFFPNFTTKTSGTGLGLAISKNIIESFGGDIYFETTLDKGTSFFVELPIYEPNNGEA